MEASQPISRGAIDWTGRRAGENRTGCAMGTLDSRFVLIKSRYVTEKVARYK